MFLIKHLRYFLNFIKKMILLHNGTYTYVLIHFSHKKKKSINHQIMASSLITSWQVGGETMGTVTNFIFLGSKTTAGGDCSHEIKRRLLAINAGEGVEKREPSYTVGGNAN